MTVRGLADLTRKYGAGLLKGDTSQFSILQARRLARSEAQKRARLMRELELPESAGEGSQQLSTAELQFRADQQLKERILAEHSGEVSDLQDLPASEFVKRYFSRQLKGG
jgi:hypothetical protein